MRAYSPLAVAFILLAGVSARAHAATISPLQCGNPGSTVASASDTAINANSCTDFSYLSPNSQTLPVNNWLYGYYQGNLNPTGFSVMTQQIPQGSFGWWASDFTHLWTSLDAFGGHPNSVITDLHNAPYCDPTLGGSPGNCGTGPDTNPAHAQDFITQWAVRRYVVPIGFQGTVMITLSVQKDPRTSSANADGDLNYVMLYDGSTVTQLGSPLQTPPAITATGAAGTPVETQTFTAFVTGGTFIDFAISPNQNDFSDGEFQLISIQSVPEPGTWVLVMGGLLLVGLAKRRFA